MSRARGWQTLVWRFFPSPIFFFFFAIICWISWIFCPTEFPLVCICKWHILVSFKVFLCLLYLLAIRFRSFIRFRFNFFSNTTLFYFIDSIVDFHEGHIMSNYLSSLWKTWWPMSISINSLEVEKWWFCIFIISSFTANITCFLEIVITMFDMKRASCLGHLHIPYFFLEISCTTSMRRQASFQSSWRHGSAASYLPQMRPFKQPCQRCWTALIQLRFTSKQDLMCSRVSWVERTEKALSILKSLFTIPQAKVLI